MRSGFAGIMGFLLVIVLVACVLLAIFGTAYSQLLYIGLGGMAISVVMHRDWVNRKRKGQEVSAIKWGLISFLLSAALTMGCLFARLFVS